MKNLLIQNKNEDFNLNLSILNKSSNEIKGIIYFGIASALFGINNFQMKIFRVWFPDDFDESSFIIWRSLLMPIISYYNLKQDNQEVLDYNEIKNKLWFIIRMSSNFLTLILLIPALKYLRVATASTIVSMYPILTIILAVIILKEKFFWKYVAFTVIGFLCSLMMIMNDKNYQDSISEDNQKPNADTQNTQNTSEILLGTILGILAMLMISLNVIATKILVADKINFNNQMFYIGLSNAILGLISSIFSFYISFRLSFILVCFVNSLTFYISSKFMILAFEYIDAAKTTPLAYLGIIVNFVLGVILLGEPVFLTDLIGSLVILGCNVYYARMAKN